ncbi:MAG: hypothetical protein K0R47_1928, partial [Brevibacillus sp.]|nr:hypothetical protein [Brevibacillus sp.]
MMAVDTFDTYLAEKTAYIEDKLTPALEQVGVPAALFDS